MVHYRVNCNLNQINSNSSIAIAESQCFRVELKRTSFSQEAILGI
ncbi:9167_t:CDS:2 [Entrophospora sp. SA101]|nr:9167_t:CDS:2 [Entrophospora sp. SA101]